MPGFGERRRVGQTWTVPQGRRWPIHLIKILYVISALWLNYETILSVVSSFQKLSNCSLPRPPIQNQMSMMSFSEGRLMLCGGASSHFVPADLCYSFSEGNWSSTFSLNAARFSATLTPLSDGSLWVAGGTNSYSGVLRSTEVLTSTGWGRSV